MNKKIVVLPIVLCGLLLSFAFLTRQHVAAADPRILLFETFNRATNYNEVKPLVSDGLAQGLDFTNTQHPDQIVKALNYLQFIAYQPRLVELDPNNSFLVLEHAKSKFESNKEERAVYLLSRRGGNWTIARRMEPQQIIFSLWSRDFSPSEFNEPSTCSISGSSLDASLNGKEWNLKSAAAFRKKDEIEIDLFPFPLQEADLDYWKYWSGKLDDMGTFQTSFLNAFHPECRIVFGLDQNGQVTFVNVGFNNPKPHFSAVWQGPGWAWAPPKVPKPNTSNGLPPEFRTFEVTRNRIKLETAGQLQSSGTTIRWSAKIDIPLWERGL